MLRKASCAVSCLRDWHGKLTHPTILHALPPEHRRLRRAGHGDGSLRAWCSFITDPQARTISSRIDEFPLSRLALSIAVMAEVVIGVMTESSRDPTLRCPIGSPAKEPEWAPQLF